MIRNEKTPLVASRKQSARKKARLKKLLAIAAVVLFTFILQKALGKSSLQTKGIQDPTTSYSQLISSKEYKEKYNPEDSSMSFLGSPFSALEQVLFQSAYGAVDFTLDDAEEESCLVFVQDSSLMAPNCPDPESLFGNFKKEITTYIVKEGDNPEKIAVAHGINTDTLLWANGLKDGDIIRPGDKLIILPINGVRVKVLAGETIQSIAKKYQGKVEEIIAFNNLPEDGSLKIGEYIIVPGGEMSTPSTPAKPKATPKPPRYASSVQSVGWLVIPTTGRNWGRIHASNGVDISNDCGTPIYAAASGKIILADDSGWNGGYGKYIKIQHLNGVVTLYAHLSSLAVSIGENVAQGQYLGAMGTTGRSTGCHLHFEVRGAKNPLAR